MKRTLVGILAVVASSTLYAAGTIKMWGCSVGGRPGNAVVLVSGGSHSYVKLSGQRVSATITETDEEVRWAWGNNAIDLDDSGIARYYEAGDEENPKGTFRCRELR